MKAVAVSVIALLVACGSPPARPAQAPTATREVAPPRRRPSLACPAGEVVPGVELRPDCAARSRACVDACGAGDRQSCYWLAQATLADPATRDDAQPLFHRACELGHASGCTNYGAKLAVDDIELDCAGRLFERACSVDDHHGCGMMAIMMLNDEQPPGDAARARARAHLEVSCDRIGGFPCHVLAVQIQRGTFAAADPAQAQRLLTRACDTGDRTACDEARAVEGAAAP